ncbi:MAG: hypothetical protein K2Q18_07285 [Bdellovibrionales bacterium]|nr:hypothetical protein [Bdellovibrionales bacterium]
MSKHSTQLFHFVLRLSKEDSAFFYFQLEASDGLCFYSTLEHPHHAQYRDIELRGDILLKAEVLHLIKECSKKFKIDILLDETILDKKGTV